MQYFDNMNLHKQNSVRWPEDVQHESRRKHVTRLYASDIDASDILTTSNSHRASDAVVTFESIRKHEWLCSKHNILGAIRCIKTGRADSAKHKCAPYRTAVSI